MRKDWTINLRVRREQVEKIKELGFKTSDCWELGYERICENERSELEKLDKKYHNLYIHVHTKLLSFGKRQLSENKELDDLLVWYNRRGTGIHNPTGLDVDTVKFQLVKRKIKSFTVEQVFDYWRSKEKKA